MSDLINRVKCPMGCATGMISEQVKVINESPSNMLLEGQPQNKQLRIKVYTCHCCGNVFEMQQRNVDGRFIL